MLSLERLEVAGLGTPDDAAQGSEVLAYSRISPIDGLACWFLAGPSLELALSMCNDPAMNG